jgi:GNAT superfamily N-acetyltransferase
MEKILLDRNFIIDIENQEAQYWSEYYLCSINPLTKKLGIYLNVIGGTVCCSVSNFDVLAFNRSIGIGLYYPITEEHLENIIQFYENAGVNRFMVQVSPAAEPDNYDSIFNKMGFTHHNNWAKFYKRIENKPPDADTNLTVDELMLSETETFDKIINDSFEFGRVSEVLFTQTFKRPGWKHYLAKENNKPIAAASMFVCGKYASLAIAGTLPDERGKGAQKELITRRINDAHNLGCEFVVVETAEDKPEKPSYSNRNMKYFGFEQAYLRPNYVYKF